MKQIIVNVSGLSVEEKQRVNEALANLISVEPCRDPRWTKVCSMYAPSSLGHCVRWSSLEARDSTHTPQQVLEMAGMTKQGHVHAENMALYAEDAKTTDKPWELWQVKDIAGIWWECKNNPLWGGDTGYRRKPKTHIANGVEVPDLRIVPNEGEEYHLPNPLVAHLFITATCGSETYKYHRVSNNLCYEPTEEGKQAAILHAKAWLGIA